MTKIRPGDIYWDEINQRYILVVQTNKGLRGDYLSYQSSRWVLDSSQVFTASALNIEEYIHHGDFIFSANLWEVLHDVKKSKTEL